jgi:methionyl-tRNA formyltransferase
MKYSLAVAGSTAHTVQCIEALLQDKRFTLSWILTPSPKPIGRQQLLAKNPLHELAEKNRTPTILIEQKIDLEIKKSIMDQPKPDYLLVVDFGYLIPDWLLTLPQIAPLNIHPSDLPRWRGSSPGQFVLLNGEKQSAVTLMIMSAGLDEGDIVHKITFDVHPTWTQTEYYHESFELIKAVLADKMVELAEKKITPVPQPDESSTPIARRLTKEDGFVQWEIVKAAMSNTLPSHSSSSTKFTAELLMEACALHHSWATTLFNASRGLSPWPGLWTIIPTSKGEKRMQILRTSLDQKTQTLVIEKVKIEGQNDANWNDVKNTVLS